MYIWMYTYITVGDTEGPYFPLSIWSLQQSTKAYKRHSSIIPSSHLLAEVEETIPSLDGNDFEPGEY